MSSQLPSGKEELNSTKAPLPIMLNGKSNAAPPQVSKNEDVELSDIPDAEAKLPLHEDIMQLARLGEIGPIQKLFEGGKFKADHCDEEGITPLHWAAINNHYALCKFLIGSGANVNAKGGEAVATPAMWAAQRCNYYVGYNILHLATFDGNVFLLVLLLHQNIPIDGPDPQGHTCLMWAAYKGYPAVVDLFLRWGASVNATDENGFTALHWSVVKGSQVCMYKLIEYGSDRFAETFDKKTPTIIAEEMKCTRFWHRALEEHGFDDDGNNKQFPLPFGSTIKQRHFLNRFFFLYPFVVIFLVLYILSGLPIFAGLPIAFFCAYFLQWAAQHLLLWAPSDMKHLQRTPYLAGVFAGTLFWVGIRWLQKILPSTYKTHLLMNMTFAISYVMCTYFYTISMVEDPGYVPKLGSRSQQKAVIEELLTLWKFDDQNFCVQCMVRMPVRSKHCKRCKRCVAKHDHHCPWVHNCVAANNLRHFFSYVLFMEIGIILFVRLVIAHLENSHPPSETQCNVLAESICTFILRDTFTVVLAIWSSLQLTWVTMLFLVQLVQIARATTTYEAMRGRGGRHGHSHGHTSQATDAVTAALTAGSTSMDGAQLTSGGRGPGAPHPHPHPHSEGCFAQWKKLLGLDTFLATASGGLKPRTGRAQRPSNPFSRGVVTNCKDFWCDPAPFFGRRETGLGMLGGEVVDYTKMYESPPRMRTTRGGRGGVYSSVGEGDDSV